MKPGHTFDIEGAAGLRRGGDGSILHQGVQLLAMGGGEAQRITHVSGGASNPQWRRDGKAILFESAYARDTYQRIIGTPTGLVRCVFNGVTATEFDPVALAEDATDVAYVGEFRHIKGADILIDVND